MFDFSVGSIIAKVIIILIALPLHEFAHAAVAFKLGDNTARDEGRLSVNPIRHLDPLGTILLMVAGFGWAKPVPVNPWHFKNRKQGMMLVSLAGPLSNLSLAVLAVIVLGFLKPSGNTLFIFYNFIYINVLLAVFNFLPIPPLDGSKILAGILPGRQQWLYQLEQYGTPILFLLIFLGILSPVLRFFIDPIMNLLNLLAMLVAGFSS
ncbi:site-2 protease family protein [Desulforamulus ruminis]|uniref:Peptidase M50 n=1 Tax=Desulforamulus ruminis (strain ATCC 23193 / DSM 2154 / NCIMB 8452 / DL) TaxID=696281 RepID=F6DT82_DESRL|nr:site-2 protease family protein [Desulforamulus ruminis]AEG61187.1 peptidase M50 [Desulforamulus ruminis DSM 2154]